MTSVKKIICLSVFIMILCSTAIPAYSCTVFNVSNTNAVLVGNNEDYNDTDTKVWFVPADDARFGKICFGFDFTYPQGGMNDQGLFFDWYAFGELMPSPVTPGQMLPGGIKLEKTPSIDELILFYKNNENANDILLDTCKTVDDVLILYEKYYEPCFGYAQLMVVDKYGSSAVLTWDWDKNELKIDRKNGDYQVIGIGTRVIGRELHEGNYEFSPYYFKTLLQGASVDITRYSNIYDLKNGTVEVFSMGDFDTSVVFDISDELDKGDAFYSLASFFPEKQVHSRWYFFGVTAAVGLGIFLVFVYIIIRRKWQLK